MKDVEFVSELFVILIAGIQDGQKTLDKFYADYDVVFPRRSSYIGKFNQILASLETLCPYLAGSRYTKKADFYALFAATAEMNDGGRKPQDLSGAQKRLEKLERDLNKDPDQLTGSAGRYYSTVVEGPNKRAKREERVAIIKELLDQG